MIDRSSSRNPTGNDTVSSRGRVPHSGEKIGVLGQTHEDQGDRMTMPRSDQSPIHAVFDEILGVSIPFGHERNSMAEPTSE